MSLSLDRAGEVTWSGELQTLLGSKTTFYIYPAYNKGGVKGRAGFFFCFGFCFYKRSVTNYKVIFLTNVAKRCILRGCFSRR